MALQSMSAGVPPATKALPMSRPIHLKPQHTQLRSAIQKIMNDLDNDPNRMHSIPQIYRKHQVKRRPLCDIINVFTAIGCATRSGVDELVWHGRDQIFPELLRARNSLNVQGSQTSLSSMFPIDNSVGLSSLTTSFILMFTAMQVDVLDLRIVSSFFSRSTSRYKTTLCKLYQVALILNVLDITGRTENVCEIRLLPPFTRLLTNDDDNPLALRNLLNRPTPMDGNIEARRKEYHAYAAKSSVLRSEFSE
jgi:hypothetical protein